MTLKERYEQDPGLAFYLTREELYELLREVGETEPIIDALIVLDQKHPVVEDVHW